MAKKGERKIIPVISLFFPLSQPGSYSCEKYPNFKCALNGLRKKGIGINKTKFSKSLREKGIDDVIIYDKVPIRVITRVDTGEDMKVIFKEELSSLNLLPEKEVSRPPSPPKEKEVVVDNLMVVPYPSIGDNGVPSSFPVKLSHVSRALKVKEEEIIHQLKTEHSVWLKGGVIVPSYRAKDLLSFFLEKEILSWLGWSRVIHHLYSLSGGCLERGF